LQRYQVAHKEWSFRVKPATLPVEKMHSEQRNKSRQWQRRLVSFARQACAEFVQHLSKMWRLRGGRDMRLLDEDYLEDLRSGKKQQSAHYARPNQIGNCEIFWITEA